ncbi:MAG: hypothetical protein IKO06_02905 [Alphaproteobacteria bacterium]|nr:hypothetical protein [Alphaproteobacteria bacterium]
MSDKRDEKIEERLDQMSSLIKHSEKNDEKYYAGISADENAKEDILKELPGNIRVIALQNGMSLDELRSLYAETKLEYYAKKSEYANSGYYADNVRRQDNVRERFNPNDRQNQNEQLRGRGGRYYEGRQRTHS